MIKDLRRRGDGIHKCVAPNRYGIQMQENYYGRYTRKQNNTLV